MTPVIAYALWQGWQALNFIPASDKQRWGFLSIVSFAFGWLVIAPLTGM